MKREKKLTYHSTILLVITTVALVCSFFIILSFHQKTFKSNVHLNFKINTDVSYNILINDSLVITSSKVTKLAPEGFYKQTKLNIHLQNGHYLIAVKDLQNKTLSRGTFDIANHIEKYIYLFIDEIEIKNQPYILD